MITSMVWQASDYALIITSTTSFVALITPLYLRYRQGVSDKNQRKLTEFEQLLKEVIEHTIDDADAASMIKYKADRNVDFDTKDRTVDHHVAQFRLAIFCSSNGVEFGGAQVALNQYWLAHMNILSAEGDDFERGGAVNDAKKKMIEELARLSKAVHDKFS